MGGLSKKATKIKERSHFPSSTLLIDAGAMLFPEPAMATGLQLEQAKISARGIAGIYQEMGYDAVGIAERDLAAGAEFLQSIAGETDYPWLSANLVGKEDGSPLFTPSAVIRKGEITVGLTALTGWNKEDGEDRGGEGTVEFLPWLQALPPVLDDLRKKSELIILLSNLPEGVNREISSRYPGIHIIIQSGQRISNLQPRLYGNTLISQTSDQGKYLGEMEVTWRPSGKWDKSTDSAPLVAKKSELDRLNWQLTNMLDKGDPEEVYKNRPEMLKRIDYLRKRTETLNREIARLKEQDGHKKGGEWENTFWPLSSDISDTEEVAALIERIKERKAVMAQKINTTRDLPGYSGSAECQRCHEQIFEAWKETPHAEAWWTLKRKKENYNMNCLPCHVTGLAADEGARALSLPARLHNVGCESCHGPGSDHAGNPEAGNIKGSPDRRTCLNCHKQEHDNSFDFARDRLLVH